MPAALLHRVIQKLDKYYGAPAKPFPTDPFQQILWVNVAYLADDTRRAAAFKTLKTNVGLTPEKVFHAPIAKLRTATKFGILPDRFAEKLRECAQIALDEFNGDLKAVVSLPVAEATRALRKFPGIGEPGAEQILLFSGRQALLAPDSNGLRVLQRLGLCAIQTSYATAYAEAREITSRQLGADTPLMQQAHQLLRRHGQELCRTTAPACNRCPLASSCPRTGVSP
jgi:endonuclease III